MNVVPHVGNIFTFVPKQNHTPCFSYTLNKSIDFTCYECIRPSLAIHMSVFISERMFIFYSYYYSCKSTGIATKNKLNKIVSLLPSEHSELHQSAVQMFFYMQYFHFLTFDEFRCNTFM